MKRTAILANPVSGHWDADEKRDRLQPAADILDADIHGLDTTSEDDFIACGRALANDFDRLIIAGGDGTFSQIVNAIDTSKITLGYFPLGSGNALKSAFGIRRLSFSQIACQIRDGDEKSLDLIDCDGRKRAFMTSVGIEAVVLSLRKKHSTAGRSRFSAYFHASIDSYFREYKRAPAEITIDDKTFYVKRLLSALIVKQPYYGYGMNVVPAARFNDGKLHSLIVETGLLGTGLLIAEAFTIGNRVGQSNSAQEITIRSDTPLRLQYDGEIGWEATSFNFRILPGVVRVAGCNI